MRTLSRFIVGSIIAAASSVVLVACAVPGLLMAYTIYGAGAAAGLLSVSMAAGVAGHAIELAVEQGQASRCQMLVDKDLAVREVAGLAVSGDEEKIVLFEPVFWWSDSLSRADRSVTQPADAPSGRFAITEHAALFVAPEGAAGLRYPYESMAKVETDAVNPHWVVLNSFCGRCDILAFTRRDSSGFDPDGAAAAAKAIKTHVARVRSRD
ncbi:MAG: hypothetical protein IPN24_19545 [Betaproteobacteria bacterium]|nr:hypothetical protein [Betaproteobacteria bacterium]MBK8690495.1 hypothetical protein [Betaproteobacteria bacterium]